MADDQMLFDWAGGDGKDSPESRDADAAPTPLNAIRPLADKLRALAAKGIYLGTSSWKYPGWLGRVYDPARYETRGKHSKAKFERECLREYASIFPTVGGDFAFYQFPSEQFWKDLFDQAPAGFKLSLKIPEDITVERFPDIPRYGRRAGKPNPEFLNAQTLKTLLLDRLAPYHDKLGVLMFEFGTIRSGPLKDPGRFAGGLSGMLAELPTESVDFAVEIRNPEFLTEGTGYLNALREHGVAHCFNSWTRMPPVEEQLAIDGAFSARHAAARFLLRPGRSYEEAVEAFSPYERIREPYAEGREALRRLVEEAMDQKRRLYAFVNNRFEGNAVDTIEAVCNSLL